ncbi:MAG: MauE/DoxX family redox-associated membrane protein, partial [Solirubrobacteraceae bacterium]
RPATSAQILRAAGVPAPEAVMRLVAVAELAVAAAGLALPGRVGGIVVAVMFAALAVAAAFGGRGGGEIACGCFGDAGGASLGARHVFGNLAAAILAAAAALAAPSALAALAVQRPAEGLIALALALVIAVGVRGWLRGGGLHSLEGSAMALVDSSARLLESRISRRSALVRMAVAGSALSIAPLRYLLYPGTAMGVVLPGDCAGGLCTDGYTAFCCEINQELNTCPTGTFIGGWWMCTDYVGHQLCNDAGVRYYIDCNALPGHPFPGGCKCANNSCEHRKQACNVFRYGQCNTEIKGTTAVVCRVITCENPGHLKGFGCSTAVMVDDATCPHEAPCLQPAAKQVGAAGGA